MCCQYENLIHKTYAQRVPLLIHFYQDTLLPNAIDSALLFNRINTIESFSKSKGDEDLIMETELMRIVYLFYHTNTSGAVLISRLSQLQQKAISFHKQWLSAKLESLAALYYFGNGHNYELSFVHLQNLYSYILKLTIGEFPDKLSCFSQIGDAYYYFSDYPNAIKFFKEGVDEIVEKKEYNKTQTVQIANTLGLCYQKLKAYDSSNYYFKLAYDNADNNNSIKRAWLGISSGNLGYNYYLQGAYDKAEPLLQTDVEIAIEYKDWGLAVGSLTPLGAIALQQHDITKAEKCLAQAKLFTELSGQYKRYELLYPQLSKLEAAKGNNKMAAVYLDSALIVKDSIARKFNALQMTRALQKAELEQHNAALAKLENEKQTDIYERNFLMLGLLLLVIIIVVVYKQQTQRIQIKQEALVKSEEQLASATQQLNIFTKKIHENNILLETLQSQTSNINNEVLKQLQQSTILTDDEWDSFRKAFESVHKGFLLRLKDKLPELSPAETRFMVLSKLKLSNKEMAATLGVGTDAIRQYRSRIRKKLNLTEESGLEDLIDTI